MKKLFFSSILFVILMAAFNAQAQNPLGIGPNELILPSQKPTSGLMLWINTQQKEFYQSLSKTLQDMRETGVGLWMLLALSFGYGVFHAAGPGHGKIVLSSYMLANERTLHRGILLSFASAALQAITAITITTVLFFALSQTSIAMKQTTKLLEVSSYGLLCSFGAWLVWKKISKQARLLKKKNHANSFDGSKQNFEQTHPCCSSHASIITGSSVLLEKNFNPRAAWFAVSAIGLRPCSGALIILSFAFLNELWLGGIISVFAMALGVAFTTSMLATLAVLGKNFLEKKAIYTSKVIMLSSALEIGGALLIFLFGLIMLTASLSSY